MENNKKKITDYIQDLGALIALLLCPCSASRQLMD